MTLMEEKVFKHWKHDKGTKPNNICHSHLVFILKRAQILIADLWYGSIFLQKKSNWHW